MVPPEVSERVPEPTLLVAKAKGPVVVRLTLLLPLLFKVTAPTKSLFCVKVMALAPALKVAVPGTVITPVCVIAPPAVAERLPPFTKVKAVKAMPALSKTTVKLREFVKLAKLVGKVAAASILRKPTSRMLPKLPPKVTAPLKSLGCVFKRTSEFATVEAKVTVPAPAAWVIAPVSVIEPPEVSERAPLPTEEAARVKGALLTKLTSLAPELFKETAEVKLFVLLASVRAPALALKLAESAELA